MEINLLSLSTNPSDHDCREGDLAAMANLINEDGALQPIQSPEEVATVEFYSSGFNYDVADAKLYIHEVDNDSTSSDDHQNYIAVISGNSGYHLLWCDDIYADAPVWNEVEGLSGFQINGISFTGRIIACVGEQSTKYIIWKGTGYYLYSYNDFSFDVSIDSKRYAITVEDPEDEGTYIDPYAYLDELSECFTEGGLATIEGQKAILEALDAAVENQIQKQAEPAICNKYTSYGIAALRLYDGQYIATSDVFVIGSDKPASRFRVETSDGTIEGAKRVLWEAGYHTDTIEINMPDVSSFGDLIWGVDVFVTAPLTFNNMEKAAVNVMSTSAQFFTYQMYKLTDQKLYETIDGLAFYRSVEIPKEQFGNAVNIRRINETETSFPLSDFRRTNYGAKCVFGYNGRLNIGDVTTVTDIEPQGKVSYSFSDGNAKFNGMLVEVGSDHSLLDADIYFIVHWSGVYQERNTTVIKGQSLFPMPPVFMLPFATANTVDIYIRYANASSAVSWWKRTGIQVHQSTTGNWSYFVFSHIYNEQQEQFWLQPFSYTDIGTLPSGMLEEIMYDEFNAIEEQYAETNRYILNRYRNKLMVSETDNPMVFKDAASVYIGNGSILALAAPTQPIAEGQAGKTPMVAFTTEGLWPVYVDASTGYYSATQPAPRDVLIKRDDGSYNTNILSIDDAILFLTDRGVMMYSGSQTKCMSESLQRDVAQITLPHLADIVNTQSEFFNADDNGLRSYLYASTFKEFLKEAKMAYDYTNQRILVSSKVSSHTLALSLRSGAWGVLECPIQQCLNSYPEALVTYLTTKVVTVKNPDTPSGSCAITYSLSHAASVNTASSVTSGSAYSTTIVPSPGYDIKEISVMMGDEDITDEVVSGTAIAIESVTDDVIITVTSSMSDSDSLYYRVVDASVNAFAEDNLSVWDDILAKGAKIDFALDDEDKYSFSLANYKYKKLLLLIPSAYDITDLVITIDGTPISEVWTLDKLAKAGYISVGNRYESTVQVSGADTPVSFYKYSFYWGELTSRSNVLETFTIGFAESGKGMYDRRQNRAPIPAGKEYKPALSVRNLYASLAEPVDFYCITRPLGLGEPDTLKRISAAIVRGYFAKGNVKSAVYGSRDLRNWFLINTSVDQYLRNRMGSPYKYFRFVLVGQLDEDESIQGIGIEAAKSLDNQLR